jgi:hypothetical protein
MIRTLADLSIEDALDATVRDASSQLRDIVLRLAAKRLGEGPELLTFRAMVERVKRATEKRNMLAHALVVKLRRTYGLVLSDVSGGGGMGSATSVAIFQPVGVRTHSTIIKKGFGTGVCPAYATEIRNGT